MKNQQTKIGSPEWIEEKAREIQLDEDMQAEAEATAKAQPDTARHSPLPEMTDEEYEQLKAREKYGEQGTAYLPPKHSPLPWSCEAGDLCDANGSVITEIWTIDGRLAAKCVNHAEKLAEALRKAVAIIKSYDHVSGIAEMEMVLEDYERSAQ